MLERLSKLHMLFQGDDRVLIAITADPDAIASAMALKRLLWRRVSSVTIARTNIVKRPDNLALMGFLKMHMVHLSEINLKDYTVLAMVDSQPHHMESLSTVKFDVVIDHHPVGKNTARFQDVRSDYGATSTIMLEYLRAAKIKPSRSLATALFYGIKTDTNNFARQGMVEDVRAFRFLFPLINQNMINKIEKSELTRADLKHYQRALERVKIRKDLAFLYMGRVDNPDILVMMADFFMKIHDINTSIAAGLSKDQIVVIFRVAGHRKNAGKMASAAFASYGSAGGHKAMARAEVPISRLEPKLLEQEGQLERFLLRRIRMHGQREKGHQKA
jgi:nanoRNase/pAp phosphatase (c-di-AMP/oligoRNAs hydrolase)